MTIENRGADSVRIQYTYFSLVSDSGKTFSALPPFPLNERGLATSGDRAPLASPALEYENFAIAPAYAGLYPGIAVYEGEFSMEPEYHATYHSYWARRSLPSQDMLDRAIPKGVLLPDGRLSGFLYFERVPSAVEGFEFRTELVGAESSAQLGVAGIPFVLAE